MKTWRATNLIAGHLIFGLPALAVVPALAATIARFGLGSTLVTAIVPALAAISPWLLWLRYTRHRPTSRRAHFAWATLALVVTVAIGVSPLWSWNLSVLALLLSEGLRCLIHRPPTGRSITPARASTS